MGDPSAGAKAGGADWPTGERVARFREFVELVNLRLRQEVTTNSLAAGSRDGAAAMRTVRPRSWSRQAKGPDGT